MRLIQLLQQKNHFLHQFYSLNDQEGRNFSIGDFQNLDHFYNAREKILELIAQIDSDLSSITDLPSLVADSEREQVRELLKEKDDIVNRILAQDLQILSWIEREKSSIIRELQDIKRVKGALRTYRSRLPTAGFNEEA